MPNIDSAKKRMRQSKKRRARNKWRKDRVKVQVRTLMEAIRNKDLSTAESEFKKTCSIPKHLLGSQRARLQELHSLDGSIDRKIFFVYIGGFVNIELLKRFHYIPSSSLAAAGFTTLD